MTDCLYEVHNHEIASKMVKQKVHLHNLSLIHIERPGFDSANARFSHYEAKDEEAEKEKELKERQRLEKAGGLKPVTIRRREMVR